MTKFALFLTGKSSANKFRFDKTHFLFVLGTKSFTRNQFNIQQPLKYFLSILENLTQIENIILHNNNQLILEGLIRAMPQLTERNQLM